MTLLAIPLIVFVAVLLVLSVLVQSPKGGGLSAQFGGSSASRLVGSGRAASMMEKLTWLLASILFVCTVGFNMFLGSQEGQGSEQVDSPNVRRAQKNQPDSPEKTPDEATQVEKKEEEEEEIAPMPEVQGSQKVDVTPISSEEDPSNKK